MMKNMKKDDFLNLFKESHTTFEVCRVFLSKAEERSNGLATYEHEMKEAIEEWEAAVEAGNV